MEVAKDVAGLPGWGGIPHLEAVIECPAYSRGGVLIDRPGYHAGACLWYHPAAGLKVPPVPPVPPTEDVDRAKALLLVELYGDFPFEDDASRAHALAALLLPFIRQMIDGPTPLHLLDAPVEGTGKTLLANCMGVVVTGRDVESIAEGRDDEEWRKRITSILAEGPTFILLDNINRTLDSGALASALTARTWKDRILGSTKTISLPNAAVWLASGNNTKMSRELIRRTVWCRLDSRTDAPWERSDFRHANLFTWTKENRGQLVWAALVLCQAWVAAGRPKGKEVLGMYESWAETMGGILQVIGVPGLLTNADKFRKASGDMSNEWRSFVVSWWQKFADNPVGVRELFLLAAGEQMLDSVLGDKGERSQRTRLGRALGKMRERVIGDLCIKDCGEDHSATQKYRLEPTGDMRWEEV
jgi:hypothetical protein